MTSGFNDLMNLYAEISAKQDELISLLSKLAKKQNEEILHLINISDVERNVDSSELETVLGKVMKYEEARQDF